MAEVTAPKALLFDWDDTITHNWFRVFQSMNKTLKYFGYSEWSDDEAKRRLGMAASDVFPKIFDSKAKEASVVYYDFLSDLDDSPAIEGAVDSIRGLSSNTNLYMGVLSNKLGVVLREEATKLGLNDCFSKIIGSKDAEFDKPARQAVDKALEGSGLKPRPDIWFIGDSHVDMQCAHDNGCTAVLIESKTPPDDMLKGIEPHLRFKDCRSLSNYLLENFPDEIGLILKQTQCK